MYTNKSFRQTMALMLSMTLATCACSAFAAKDKDNTSDAAQAAEAATAASQVLEYKLALAEDGKTYQVVMKPAATPKPDLSLTGQVTIKVPHGTDFKIAGLTSIVESSNWVEASRVAAPSEDANSDYISFSFVGLQGGSARNYKWEEGKEQVIFTFQNEGGCIDGVSLMASDDPFNVTPNSANTNPGNQFTNLGWGSVSDNNYKGNYGDPIVCPK